MEALAKYRYARIAAQKVRLVIEQIRKKPIEEAVQILKFSRKRASVMVLKVLQSAIANAEHNESADIDELYVCLACVDEGPTIKRWRARAKGRGTRILKRTCHITVGVSDEDQVRV